MNETATKPDSLLPCPHPWCDNSDPLVECDRQSWTTGSRCVECQCGMKGPTRYSDAEAISAWNTRAAPTPMIPATSTGSSGEVARLREVNEAIIKTLLLRYSGKAKRIQDIHIEERGEYCLEMWLGDGSGYMTISTYPLARAALAASSTSGLTDGGDDA